MEEVTDNLVWIDMEFSGLDVESECILEVATIVTDGQLTVLAQGPVIAINQSDSLLEAMDEWNTTHHTESGLLERVKKSRETHLSAQQKTLIFLGKHCESGQSPLCGNSVHMDRWFMRKHMPELEEFLHYRNIDVTSIKELAKRWYPDIPEFEKENTHTALNDIQESIAELGYYREKLFKSTV